MANSSSELNLFYHLSTENSLQERLPLEVSDIHKTLNFTTFSESERDISSRETHQELSSFSDIF
jgi:hypothetical protein